MASSKPLKKVNWKKMPSPILKTKTSKRDFFFLPS